MAPLSGWTPERVRYVYVAGIALLVASGCKGQPSPDGESSAMDAGDDVLAFTIHSDGASGSSAGSSSTGSATIATGDGAAASGEAGMGNQLLYDGTVGRVCQSDDDCRAANGPGINTCSLSEAIFLAVVYPTPICLSTCTFVNDNALHYCDGKDDPSSPGVCIPNPGVPVAALGMSQAGICLPWCRFAADGTVAVGSNGSAPACQLNDVCQPYIFLPPQTATGTDDGGALGIGFCWGGCTQNSDCPTGSACQTDVGNCISTVVPSLTTGTPCTSADLAMNSQDAQCNCELVAGSDAGYCTQFCITDSTTATCPAGFVCDAFEPVELMGADGGSATGFVTQNPGLSGTCLAACSLAGTADDSGSCPANSRCSASNAVGADCQP